MDTPVAFIVFNRPECTAKTLAAIRQARPPRLLVVADGPRPTRPEEAAKCAAVRKVIEDGVDWPCEVMREYATQNLGCAKRVSSGLTWAFSQAERLIVVEDDCLPDPSFFWFCEELLGRYAEDTRVGQICGCPRYFSEVDRETTYFFSRYGPIWGWASWRRAWAYYDLEMKSWPHFKRSGLLRAVTQSDTEFAKRTELYDHLYSKPPSTWDYQWGYAKLSQNLLSVMPTRNLIENIGFGAEGGTHYGAGSEFGLIKKSLKGPLIHPEFIIPDLEFDRAYAQTFAPEPLPLRTRAVNKLRRMINGKTISQS